MREKRVVFLVGPTGVGKSAVGVCLARKVGAEVVSADSMQVYRGLDIGTAKPSCKEREGVPHHLIDVADPSEPFSAARFQRLALPVIEGILSRGAWALVVGGTGLYVKTLTHGLFEGPGADPSLRRRLERRERLRPGSLHRLLERLDPRSASRIPPSNLRRVVRALEVRVKADRPISELQAQWRAGEETALGRDALRIGLDREREDLFRRIEERVESMFRLGFLREAARLFRMGLPENATAMQALGYREAFRHLSGEITLPEAKELVKRNTRRLAKRQLTWFRRDDKIQWVRIEAGESAEETAERIGRGMLK